MSIFEHFKQKAAQKLEQHFGQIVSTNDIVVPNNVHQTHFTVCIPKVFGHEKHTLERIKDWAEKQHGNEFIDSIKVTKNYLDLIPNKLMMTEMVLKEILAKKENYGNHDGIIGAGKKRSY
jgi:hypothetical protein